MRSTAGALIALAAGAAGAQVPAASDVSWGVSAAVQHRRLVERDENGNRLLEESGPMLRVLADGTLRLRNGGAVQGTAEIAGGTLDYDGRTQGGAPLTTDSRHSEAALSFAWRPWAPAAWGEAWFVLRALRQQRDIVSTRSASGLRETSTLVSPGVRWSGSFGAGAWHLQPSAEFRTSAWHRVDVDFLGLLDARELHGGRRDELALGLAASATGSPWSYALEWIHARQAVSETSTLYRGGVPVGTVHQPRIGIDDVMLRVRRAF